MSYLRFLFLLAIIRFDDKAPRNQRKKLTNCLQYDLFWSFVNNYKKCYSVGEFMTIDEMLISFRGQCSFVRDIPNKPVKYRLKVFAVCEQFRAVLWKTTRWAIEPTDTVHRLVEELKGTNRNLMCDNWYPSYVLVRELFNKITMIGTLKKINESYPHNLC